MARRSVMRDDADLRATAAVDPPEMFSSGYRSAKACRKDRCCRVPRWVLPLGGSAIVSYAWGVD